MSAIAVDRPEGTGWTGPSELQADTAAGAEMVAVATEHAARFVAGALVHDRDGTFATRTSTSWSHPASCRPRRPGSSAADPLAKAWRDVRAGGFMHPVGANRADTLLARTALGLTM